jgi:hypothetical protein
MRRILVSLPLLLLPLLFALPALAGNWGEDWGSLTWGAAIAAVPSMGKLAVLVLVLGLGGLAARFIQRGRVVPSLLVIALVCSLPTFALAANPITSNGSLGALSVSSGSVTFHTDTRVAGTGGSYFINGVQQSGTARLVELPADSGGATHEATDLSVYDFSSIDLAAGVDVFVSGEIGLILLSSSTANIAATFHLSGQNGESGSDDAGGGGGAGGGVLSLFADGDIAFSGLIDAGGGAGADSFQASGNLLGGAEGQGSAGGGSGGAGGYPFAGGNGANGGNGAVVGLPKIGGLQIGVTLSGGGGGGGGGYSGGGGGGGSSFGEAGNAGAPGSCPLVAIGGAGGGVSNNANGGAPGGGKGGTGGLLHAGGGGGGGNAPVGSAGGAGGAGGGTGQGGGGGGGGGDLCLTTGEAIPPYLHNGAGGGGGGGDGTPGTVIVGKSSQAATGAGAGGGGSVYMGSTSGDIDFSGTVLTQGGLSASSLGGDGNLTLIALASSNVLISPSASLNGQLPLSPGTTSGYLDDLPLSDFLPVGGAGGGGAGGSGLVIEAPTSVPMMSRGGWLAMTLLLVSAAVMALRRDDSHHLA